MISATFEPPAPFEYVPQLLAQSLSPRAMNDRADVVGLLNGGPVLVPRGTGAPISLLPPRASGALPTGINSAGLVTVSARFGDGAHLVVYGSGVFMEIAAPGLDVFPHAISNANEIVGVYRPVNAPVTAERAFLYDGAKLKDLGTIHRWSAAYAVNGSGAAVGTTDGLDGLETGAYFHDGIVEDLSTSEVHVVDGQAISDSGWIVGTGSVEGIIRLPAGTVKTVGLLPGGKASALSTVNNDGIAAGTAVVFGHRSPLARSSPGNEVPRAVVYRGDHLWDLARLARLPSSALLVSAVAVNRGGQVLAYGTIDGVQGAWLFTPR